MPGIKIRATSFQADSLRSLSKRIQKGLTEIVVNNLDKVAQRAQELAPKQTGGTSKAFYVAHPNRKGDYAKSTSEARSLRPDIEFDSEEQSDDDTGLTGYVVNPSKHFHILEFGGPKRIPKPSLLPAFEEKAPEFEKEVEKFLLDEFKRADIG